MKLVVLEGPAAHPSFEVHGERTLVGRAPDCDVLVYDAQVSRHHAQILRFGEVFVIESLQPSNPFIVNDQVVSSRRQLADGDLIVLGTVMMEVDLPPASEITARESVQGAQAVARPESASPAPPTTAMPVPTPSDRPTQHPVAVPSPAPAYAQVTAQPSSVEPPATTVHPRSQTVPAATQVTHQGVEQPRPQRSRALPARAPREQIKAMATRLGEAGQRLRSRADATSHGPALTDRDVRVVENIVADHERLGGDQELARLASLLSERLSNQTDIRALYRLGAEAAVLIAWSRIAQRSMEEAMHLAQALGVH